MIQTGDKMKNKALSIGLLIAAAIIFLASIFMAMLGLPGPRWLFLISLLIAIAGFADKKSIKKDKQTFLKAKKNLGTNVPFIMLCDVLFFILFFGMLFVGGSYLNERSKGIQSNMNIMSIVQMEDVDQAKDLLDDMKMLAIAAVATIAIILFLTIVFYSALKSMSWSIAANKIPSIKDIMNFFLLNLMWLPLISVLTLFFAIAFKSEFPVFLLLFMGIAFHFTIVLNATFIGTGKVWKSIGHAFKRGIMLKHFLVPYTVLALVFYLIFPLSILFAWVNANLLAVIMLVIIFPIYMALAKVYLTQVISEI